MPVKNPDSPCAPYPRRKILRVYPGRIGPGDIEAQSEIAWHRELVEEVMLKGKVAGTLELKQKGRPLLDAFAILFEEFYALSPT